MTEESKSIQEAQIIDLQSILQSSFILLGFGWVLNILTAVRYLQWSKEIASQGNGTVQVDWLSQIFFMTNITFILFGYWFFAKGIVQIPIGKNDIQSKMLKILVIITASIRPFIIVNSLYLQSINWQNLWLRLLFHSSIIVSDILFLSAMIIFLKFIMQVAKMVSASLLDLICWLTLFVYLSELIMSILQEISAILVIIDDHIPWILPRDLELLLHRLWSISAYWSNRVEIVVAIFVIVLVFLASRVKQIIFPTVAINSN